MRRVIALMMATTFLLPALSWAFEIESYSPKREEASSSLPSGFSLAPEAGKVISARVSSGAPTLVLIQDLHCNYEVQANIRKILLSLRQQHPDLRLIGVEGATGIVPTQSLAARPDTRGKRAVVTYFMHEGKLTGADYLALCDRAPVEIFGAEDADLYGRSLKLVEQFGTEENIGRMLELTEQVNFLRGREYNAALLLFERRREAAIQGRIDSAEYHAGLLKEARRQGLAVTGLEAADLQERLLADRELERSLRERLFINDRERRLFAYQRQLELGERILSVSAAPEEISEYRELNRQATLAARQREIQPALTALGYFQGVQPRLAEELTGLQASVENGLEFYQLAESRNQALFQNAVARMQARKDRVAVLIAGGFHTRAIGELARAKGYSVVGIRPHQARFEQTSNYLQLLQHPGQPTLLERLLAGKAGRTAAIAPPYGLIQLQGVLSSPLPNTFLDSILSVLDQRQAAEVSGIRIAWEANNVAVITETGTATRVYAFRDSAGNVLFASDRDQALRQASAGSAFSAFLQRAGETLSRRPVLIAGLLIGAAALTVALLAFSAPVAGIFAAVGTLTISADAAFLGLQAAMALSVVFIAGWGLASALGKARPLPRWAPVIAAVFIAGLFLIGNTGPVMAEGLTHAATTQASSYSLVHAVGGALHPVVQALGLTVHAQTQATAAQAANAAFSAAPLMGNSLGVVVAMVGTRLAGRVLSTQNATGFHSLSALYGEQLKFNVALNDVKHNGRPMEEEESEATLPGGYNVANQTRMERGWRAFSRLGLGALMPEGVGSDTTVISQYLATLDRYARVANLPAEGEPGETPIISAFFHDVKGGIVFILHSIKVTYWQFFGSEDFVAGDFQPALIKGRLAQEVDRRKVDRLVLSNLGIDPNAKTAEVLARLEEMERAGTLEKQLLVAVNALIATNDLVFQVDRARPEDSRDQNLSEVHPELAYLIEMTKNTLRRGTLNQPGGMTTRELRGANRAMLEMLYPQQDRASRPARGQVAAAIRQAFINAYDAFALWTYFEAQPGFGIVVKQGADGRPELSARPDSLLAKADPRTRDMFLRIFFRGAKRNRYNAATPNPVSAFFHALRENAAQADAWVEDAVVDGSMHELAHKTVHLLPDENESDANLSPTERARQKEFSQQRWKQIAYQLSDDRGALQTSVAATKDAYKAVLNRDTADGISDDFVLELFCDRFSMFADRMDRELDAFEAAVAQAPGYRGIRPENFEQWTEMEAAGVIRLLETRFGMTPVERAQLEKRLREANPGRTKLLLGDPFINTAELAIYQDVLAPHFTQMGDLFPRDLAGMLRLRDEGRAVYLTEQGMPAPVQAQLATQLAAAPQAHFLVQAGDPLLTLEEEYFFRKTVEYVAYFAAKGEGGQMSVAHSTSAFGRAVTGMGDGVLPLNDPTPGLNPMAEEIEVVSTTLMRPQAAASAAAEALPEAAATPSVAYDPFAGDDDVVTVAAAEAGPGVQGPGAAAAAVETEATQRAMGLPLQTGGTPAADVLAEAFDPFAAEDFTVNDSVQAGASATTAPQAATGLTAESENRKQGLGVNRSRLEVNPAGAQQPAQVNPVVVARDQAPQLTAPSLAERTSEAVAAANPAQAAASQNLIQTQTLQAGEEFFGLVDGWKNSPAPPPHPLTVMVPGEWLPVLEGAWAMGEGQLLGADQPMPTQGTVIPMFTLAGAQPLTLVQYPGGRTGVLTPYLAVPRPAGDLGEVAARSDANRNGLAPGETAALEGMLLLTPQDWSRYQNLLGNYTPNAVLAVTLLTGGSTEQFFAQALARMDLLAAAAAGIQGLSQFGVTLNQLRDQVSRQQTQPAIETLVSLYQTAAPLAGQSGVTGVLAMLDQQYQQLLAIQAAQASAQGQTQALQAGTEAAFAAGAQSVTMQFDYEQVGKVRAAAAALPENGVGVVLGDPRLTALEAARGLDLLRAELAAQGLTARVVWPSVQEERTARQRARESEAADAAAVAAVSTPRLEFARQAKNLPGDSVDIPARRIWQTSSGRSRAELFRMPGLQSELEPLPDQTTVSQSTGAVRRVMRAAIFLSEFLFLLRAMGGNAKVVLASRFRNGALPVVSMFADNSFLNALRIMSILLFGRVGDLERTVDPALAAQLQQLLPNLREQMRDLGTVRPKIEAFENARRANRGEQFNFDDPSLPASLRYSLRQLVWLMTVLQDLPVLSAALRRLDIRLTGMLPELLVVVNAFALMENVNWRISPTAYMDRETHVVLAGSLAPQVVKDLDGSKRYRAMLANLESGVTNGRMVRLTLYFLRLLARHNGNTAEDQAYRESVLKLISILSPNDRRLIEIRGFNGDQPFRTLIYLPNVIFNDPKLLDHVLTVLEQTPEGLVLMDEKNQPIEHPARVERFGGSA